MMNDGNLSSGNDSRDAVSAAVIGVTRETTDSASRESHCRGFQSTVDNGTQGVTESINGMGEPSPRVRRALS